MNAPKDLFRSHPEAILRQAVRIAAHTHVDVELLKAFGNFRLAMAEQQHDVNVGAEGRVRTSELWQRLWKYGACADGLATVGFMCDIDTLRRIFDVRADWQEWFEDVIGRREDDALDEEWHG